MLAKESYKAWSELAAHAAGTRERRIGLGLRSP